MRWRAICDRCAAKRWNNELWGERSLDHPTVLDAQPQGVGRYPGSIGPNNQGQSFAAKRKHNRISTVAALLRLRSPSAVLGAVPSIVIPAVYGEAGVPRRTHVGIERVERLPSVAHRDAAPAVIAEGMMIRVVAPIFHAAPYLVKRMTGEAVRRAPGNERLDGHAPAACAITLSERRRSYEFLDTAVASANERSAAVWHRARSSHDRPHAKALAGNVGGKTVMSHDTLLS